MLSTSVSRRMLLLARALRVHRLRIDLVAMLAIAAAPAVRAADLPVNAPLPAAYRWAGCYAGLNVGGGASGTNTTAIVGGGTHLLAADAAIVADAGTGSANTSNVMGGGQIGCNGQSGTLVYGLEGDLDYLHGNPRFTNNTNTLTDGVTGFAITQSLTSNFLATVRPRIGVAADRNLAYITGGAAFTSASYMQTYLDAAAPAGTGVATGSRSLVGWTVGAGWEYALAEHWTLRLEYLFAEFPATSATGAITDAAGGVNPLRGSADLVIQTVRAGVNLRF